VFLDFLKKNWGKGRGWLFVFLEYFYLIGWGKKGFWTWGAAVVFF
jgi:hypothetical protein